MYETNTTTAPATLPVLLAVAVIVKDVIAGGGSMPSVARCSTDAESTVARAVGLSPGAIEAFLRLNVVNERPYPNGKSGEAGVRSPLAFHSIPEARAPGSTWNQGFAGVLTCKQQHKT